MTAPPIARSSLVSLVAGGILALLLAAPAAEAQRQSKPRIPANHDRGGVSPLHLHQPQPPTHREAAPAGGAAALASGAAASRAAEVAAALRTGTFALPGDAALPAEAQQALLGLLLGEGGSGIPQLAAALAPAGNEGARPEASLLARRLHGLLAGPAELREVVLAYNALVDASAPAFLRAPSAEFLAIREVLASLLEGLASHSR